MRAVKFLKDHSQVLLDRTGAPENLWLLACEYIADVHNVCADESLNHQIPRELRHGGLQDISAFLEYRFYEPVFYLNSDVSFPSSKEKAGWWVGVASNVGDSLTYKILTDDTHKIIHRSVLRPATDDRFQNKRTRFEPPVETDSEPPATDTLTFNRRRLKIDQGLSRQRKRKQVRRQIRRPGSVSGGTPNAGDSSNDELDLNDDDGRNDDNGELASDAHLDHEDRCTTSRIFDVEHISIPVDDNLPDDRGGDDSPPLTDRGADEETDDPPQLLDRGVKDAPTGRRSTRRTNPMDRLCFRTATSTPLRSLIGGLIVGLSFGYTYDTPVPQHHPVIEGSPVHLNPNPDQFAFGSLTARESARLQELQTLDHLHDSLDPEPDDHLWKCLAVTRHKLRTLDPDDVHLKVKAIWGDGEESWVRADALRIQDPYPLVIYAVKRKLFRTPGWEWAQTYLQEDDHLNSLVHAYKSRVNGTQFMFGVEIPKNAKRALEMDKENGNTLWRDSIDKELEMINESQTFH